MKKYSGFVIVLLLWFANVKGTTILSDATGIKLLGKDLWVLKSSKEMTFEEVKASNDFQKNMQDVPNLGISSTSVWLRFTLANESNIQNALLHIAYPILDEVELYLPEPDGSYNKVLMGEILEFKKRRYQHPDYIFNLDLPKNESRTYYLRIKSAEHLILPISVSSATMLWEGLSKENSISGIFLGAVVIMFLYNLFIFFSVQDRSYIYYVIYVASVGLTQLGIKGFTFQYLWPNNPAFEVKSVILFGCISGIAALLFTQKFLHTKQNARRSHIVLYVIMFLLSIAFVVTCFGLEQFGFQLMQITTSIFAISILVVSYIVMKNGYRPGRFVFSSWSILLAGAIIFALKDYGVLPYNTFTSYSMQAASIIEMALLSFGLADRINILKKEKEASQAEALAIAKENERIIREQNVVLEEKVKERTVELEASNEELNTTLDDLKQAQIQLVESEKMASLGQLTAGIAHEINNPINFVTSNVAPLQRDVNILIDAISTMENLSMSGITVEEKQKQIEDYKEEIDYDYLKIEISHLLKGINEGASRTAEIVKGLRVFSRLDEDDLKIADIHEGIESTLVIANNLLNGIKVTKAYAELPKIECYPGKLNQVFLNIISNATHAIIARLGEGAGEGELKITTRSDSESIYIHISDNGTGMDENTSRKIFEPFFTTKNVGEGTGLGMSIAYNTIKKHNGHIRVDSLLGQGTEFIIDLPIMNKISET
ncbi:7TM diverse intracellular signaling domain-containing protein [Paradesertivirga mongoliensis]|uniref:histidine kinase n=1 Tax=Paradesertivirga mongoliensis TaxID=2100740 RepID=A0ABW4ZNE3_9SPHI|nr:7TM diverse intracellular signaling domain-containing protein [Pedobacter mongoliensis]